MIPIFRAKLRSPSTPAHYVDRQRLIQLLDELVATPLTLVVAPAGTGKTSLLAAWAGRTITPTAWLSLDETDRDAAQFWSGLLAALETIAPGCSEGSQVLVRRRNGVNEAVARLLADLEAAERPTAVLIVDDLQLADRDEAVAGSLAQFVLHLPTWLHVVLASRREPKLPLVRLRARGQLGELHYAELRFSHDEAIELVSRLLPSMPAKEIEAVADEADGWAASLQLAAIAGRSERAQRSRDLPGMRAEMQVLEYVFREVLAVEEPQLVETLTDVCVVDRVNASLARALTGKQDAVELLVSAEEQGLFVNRLAAEGWFELHPLVRDALVSELMKESPERLAEQHGRAGQWFEAQGEVTLAFEHFILAGQPGTALRLLAANEAELYDTGRETTIRLGITSIPDSEVSADLEHMIGYAWCHLLVSRRRFLELVEQARWWASRSDAESALLARVTMLEAVAAVVNCDWATSGQLARQALAAMGDAWWRDPLGRFGWNLVARDVALSERWDETLDDVRLADLALKRDPQRRVAFEGTHALGLALAGRPIDALRVAGGVQHSVDVSNMSILRAELAAAVALAHREMGDRSRATTELEELSRTPAETMFYVRLLTSAVLVEALLEEGAIDDARCTFEQARELVAAEGAAGGGTNWLPRAGVLLALATGDLAEARHWSGLIDDPFWAGVSAARVHMAEGDRAPALAALDRTGPRCVRHEVILALLIARAVQDHHVEAVKHASTAIDLAVSNGMLQTVASEGAEIVELVEASAWRAPAHWMDRFRRSVTSVGAARPRCAIDLVEPLTEREFDVVRFLPSRLTVREIADELYISQNTLKFHLKVIYRKLGVSSRAEASDMARRMMVAR
jgi:LuxR family transcriptional regulator, maltose regulon positive regulatory protein